MSFPTPSDSKGVPDGSLTSRTPVTLGELQSTVVRTMYGSDLLESTMVERISYQSEGLNILGYLAQPKTSGRFPLLIWNRGGSNDYGALDDLTAHLILASTAQWGYVVLASQYRGNMGSDGEEEWGDGDIRDAHALLRVAETLPNIDMSRLAVEGASRGGMTTYMLLLRESRFRCAIVHAGIADLFTLTGMRSDLVSIIEKKFGWLSETERTIQLKNRSALSFADQLPRNVPILMMHGTADTVVPVEQSISLSRRFDQLRVPHRLELIEGGKHVALKDGSYKQIDRWRKAWLARYLE